MAPQTEARVDAVSTGLQRPLAREEEVQPMVRPVGTPLAPIGASTRPERPRRLRIGDYVRSHIDDVCVSKGLTGLVVGTVPPRHGSPARARVVWDNDTVSMAYDTTFEVVSPEDRKKALLLGQCSAA